MSKPVSLQSQTKHWSLARLSDPTLASDVATLARIVKAVLDYTDGQVSISRWASERDGLRDIVKRLSSPPVTPPTREASEHGPPLYQHDADEYIAATPLTPGAEPIPEGAPVVLDGVPYTYGCDVYDLIRVDTPEGKA